MAILSSDSLKFCVKSYRKIKENNLKVIKEGDFLFYETYKGKKLVFLDKGIIIVSFNKELLEVFLENKKYIT